MAAPDRDEVSEGVRGLVAGSGGLAVATTVGADGRPRSTVVNAGALEHPLTGRPCVAFVGIGGARRVANLERDPWASLVFRDGHRWLTVAGTVTLIGPDHPAPGVDAAGLAGLLREIYRAAGGGEHPDWDDYDGAMREQRRVAILIDIDRAYGNG